MFMAVVRVYSDQLHPATHTGYNTRNPSWS